MGSEGWLGPVRLLLSRLVFHLLAFTSAMHTSSSPCPPNQSNRMVRWRLARSGGTGRRDGLRSHWPKGRGGSNPLPRTTKLTQTSVTSLQVYTCLASKRYNPASCRRL